MPSDGSWHCCVHPLFLSALHPLCGPVTLRPAVPIGQHMLAAAPSSVLFVFLIGGKSGYVQV